METIAGQAGLSLWIHEDMQRYPFSIWTEDVLRSGRMTLRRSMTRLRSILFHLKCVAALLPLEGRRSGRSQGARERGAGAQARRPSSRFSWQTQGDSETEDTAMRSATGHMVALGYGKYFRSDSIVGLEPVEEDCGAGKRIVLYR